MARGDTYEQQINMAMSLLELYGASPKKDLWHRIDEVVCKFHKRIERLELELKIARTSHE